MKQAKSSIGILPVRLAATPWTHPEGQAGSLWYIARVRGKAEGKKKKAEVICLAHHPSFFILPFAFLLLP
jgi:hypothetical protein